MSILLSSSFLPVYLLVAPMYQQDNQSKAYRQNSKHYQIKHIHILLCRSFLRYCISFPMNAP